MYPAALVSAMQGRDKSDDKCVKLTTPDTPRYTGNGSSHSTTPILRNNPSIRPRMRVPSSGSTTQLNRTRWFRTVAGLVIVVTHSDPAFALKCFSCVDCTDGGALSAKIQQCNPTEDLCTAVFRPGGVGSFVVDRGCASSASVHQCQSDAGTVPSLGEWENGVPSTQCCATDLCNSWGDAHGEGYRRSQEYFRNLMEGNPRSAKDEADEERALTDEDNSAQSMRGAGGSRLATVLVIVGTFAQVLWLAGSLLQ